MRCILILALLLMVGCDDETINSSSELPETPQEQLIMAMLLFESEEVADRQQGYELLNNCASRLAECQYYLALIYSEGIDRDVDIERSFSWLQMSAASGHVNAINDLTWALATSPEASIYNPEEAHQWAQLLERFHYIPPNIKDTIAAAYAGVGDFDTAVGYQLEAYNDARVGRMEPSFVNTLHTRLELYRHGMSFRTFNELAN